MMDSTWTRHLDDPGDLVPLAMLRSGQSALVGDVLGNGDLVHRLREMGLRGGARIQMVRQGCPCIIRIDGQKLCFRADEAARVLVRPGVALAC
jgi:Fe2+ transport system protein FeoA